MPTIVVSEFCTRQEIPHEILRSYEVLPFNWDDAAEAATLDFSKADRDVQSRDGLLDGVVQRVGAHPPMTLPGQDKTRVAQTATFARRRELPIWTDPVRLAEYK